MEFIRIKYIVWLHISVDDVHCVAITESRQDLLYVARALSLTHGTFKLLVVVENAVEKTSTIAEFGDQIDAHITVIITLE